MVNPASNCSSSGDCLQDLFGLGFGGLGVQMVNFKSSSLYPSSLNEVPVERVVWLVSFVVAVTVILQSLLSRKLGKSVPPGPRGWPIIGNLASLGPLPHLSLRKLAQKHGDLMFLRLGSVPCIVISSSAVAKDFLINHDLEFAHRPDKLFFSILLKDKDIVSSPYGPPHRHLRSICSTQLFTKKRLASYQAGRAEEMATLMKFILRKSTESMQDDPVINLRFQLLNTATNMLTRMVLNKRFFKEEKEQTLREAQRYQDMVGAHFTAFGRVVLSDYIPYLSFITKWQGTAKEMTGIAQNIYDTLDEMIELDARRKARAEQAEQEADHRPRDFVDVLMSTPSHNGSGPLDDFTIRVVVLNMLFAGAETQSTTLEWAMAYLLRAPEVMQRLQTELDNVVGTHRVVQESDLENLPFLEAVVKEIHRLQPGAPLSVQHESRTHSQVGGYNLPPKTRMIMNLHAIHRDPEIYERPEEFDPTRFLLQPNSRGSSPKLLQRSSSILQRSSSMQQRSLDCTLIPFGCGRRTCPGMPLANLTVPTMLAHLMHGFDWRLPEGCSAEELDMSEVFGVTARRRNPLLAVAHPRPVAYLY